MAKVEFQPGTKPLRGKQGQWLFRKWGDEYRVSPLPDYSKRIASEKQTANRQKFRQAAALASARQDDPVWQAACQRLARERGCSMRSAAISLAYREL